MQTGGSIALDPREMAGRKTAQRHSRDDVRRATPRNGHRRADAGAARGRLRAHANRDGDGRHAPSRASGARGPHEGRRAETALRAGAVRTYPAAHGTAPVRPAEKNRGNVERASRVHGERDASRRRASLSRDAVRSRSHRVPAEGGLVFRHRRLLVVAAVLVLLVLVFARPVREFYVSKRMTQDLQVKYEVLAARNKELSDDVDTLMSRDGIEEEARKNGYVTPDETETTTTTTPTLATPTTTPLDSEDEDGASQEDGTDDGDGEETTDPSAAITYPDERSWYVEALDTIFGYDPSEVLS